MGDNCECRPEEKRRLIIPDKTDKYNTPLTDFLYQCRIQIVEHVSLQPSVHVSSLNYQITFGILVLNSVTFYFCRFLDVKL